MFPEKGFTGAYTIIVRACSPIKFVSYDLAVKLLTMIKTKTKQQNKKSMTLTNKLIHSFPPDLPIFPVK
jgi:hypothetical protein